MSVEGGSRAADRLDVRVREPRRGGSPVRVERIRGVLIGLLLALVALELAGGFVLGRSGILARFDGLPAERFHEIGAGGSLIAPSDVEYIRAVLPDSVGDVAALLRWTMNQASAVGDPGPLGAAEAHRLATAGGGLVCGQMTALFRAALAVRGYTSREVQLARSLFSELDTHVTVEVLEGGRWVVYDPTFHVTFEQGGRRVGAAEIRRWLLARAGERIVPVFHGEVAYPARLEEYYLDWRPLYNNVLVFSAGGSTLLSRLPPFRYWQGPRWSYMRRAPGSPLWHVSAASAMYFAAVVLLPILIATLALALAVLTLRRRQPAGR